MHRVAKSSLPGGFPRSSASEPSAPFPRLLPLEGASCFSNPILFERGGGISLTNHAPGRDGHQPHLTVYSTAKYCRGWMCGFSRLEMALMLQVVVLKRAARRSSSFNSPACGPCNHPNQPSTSAPCCDNLFFLFLIKPFSAAVDASALPPLSESPFPTLT